MSGRVLGRDAVFLREHDSLIDKLFVKGDVIPESYDAGDHLFTPEPDWEQPQTGRGGTGMVVPGVPAEEPEPAQPPAKDAKRGDWEDFAVSQGMDRDQAEAYPNKDELIAAVG